MIVVTGAGGTVGKELVKTLAASGTSFRACYNSAEKVEKAKADRLDAARIDFAKPETVRSALEGADRLFLLATGLAGQTEAEAGAVREAKKAGVRHVVKLSVWRADQEGFGFAKVHHAVEKEIQGSGMAWTILRPNSFMQNMVNFYAPTIRTQGAFYLPSKGSRISHVDVRDIAAVATAALMSSGHEGKTYELSGPEALTYTEVAEKLSSAVGKKITYVDVSDDDFRKAATAAGIPGFYADAIVDLVHYYETGKGEPVTEDVERVTGRKPIAFDQFAADNAGSFR